MKKNCSFLLLFVLICTSSYANPIDVRKAQKAAVSYLSAVKNASSPQSRCSLVYSKTDAADEDPLLYVFAVQNGFAVVAGDDAVRPILGYSVNTTLEPGNLPSNVEAYLEGLSQQIKTIRQQQGIADRQVRQEWKALLSDTVNVQAFRQNSTRTAVSPLLSTKWGQGYYFNRYCPEGESGRAVTGCVATALAQIVRYWESPANGFGKHTYNSFYGTLSVDFGAANYQYSLMPDSLDYNTPQAQINEVSKLMYHLGVALSANYGYNATSGYDAAARAAVINHFGFNPYAGLARRDLYTEAQWVSMLKGEIDLGRPVYYSASGTSGGHVFVCDGYDASDYFHINWGWQGYCDGYFTLNNLSTGGYTFDTRHHAIFGLCPVSSPERRMVCNIDGTTEMKVDSVAYIAHTLGYNTGYQSSNYSNVFFNRMILTPQNAGQGIMIEFSQKSNPNMRFTVYDGTDDSGTELFSNNDNAGGSYLSSSDTITIVYNGYWNHTGFLLKATTVSCIPVVHSFECTERTDTSATLSWSMLNDESGTANPRLWQLEYGLRGFAQGSGTMLHPDGTPFTLYGLTQGTEYDAYLTYQCNGGSVNTVGPLHFKTNPYVECFDAIGDDNITNNYYPFSPWHTSYRLTQQLFTAEELAASGIVAGTSLSSISFECSVSCDQVQMFDNITLYLGNTNLSSYSSIQDSIPKSAMQQVWRGTVRLTPSGQKYKYTIFFDTAFVYTGNNIVVAMEKPENNFGRVQCISFYGHYTTENRALNSGGYVDNFCNSISFCTSPSCHRPQQVRYTLLSRHTVRLDWNAGDSQAWNVEYGPQGFAQGSGTMLHTDTNSVLVTHLVSGYYDFYVQANCATEQSRWTKCRVLVVIPSDDTCGTVDKFYTQTEGNITYDMETYEGDLTSTIFPMGYYGSSRNTYTQQLYTESDINKAGVFVGNAITALSFRYGGTAQTKSPIEVYLGNTSLTELRGWVSPSDLSQVYSGPVTLENGWVTIRFDVPFAYAGESVVVAVLNNSGTENGSFISYMHATQGTMALERTSYYPIDMENPQDISRYSRRNDMQFCTSSSYRMLSRDTTVYITEGAVYDFYGTQLSRQGVYSHRWVVDDDCDSLVTLTLKVRKIIYVTTTGAGLRDGSSWQNATDLQTALDTANTFTDVLPCIYVKRGTYPGNVTGKNSFVIKPNAQVYGGFAGNEPADFNLDSRDIEGNPTVLFGSNARRVLYQESDFASGKETVIDGFTIRGGAINDSVTSGGAVYMRKGCMLRNCTIMANNANVTSSLATEIRGVAVLNYGGTVKDCTIKNNRVNVASTASTRYEINGIGLFNMGGTIQGCIIQNNTVVYDGNNITPSYGGGIYCDGGTVVLNCQITQNSANEGGGLHLSQDGGRNYNFDNKNITVNGCTISNNVARTSGGGVYTREINYGWVVFSITMSNCHIGNNVSGYEGGGVYVNKNGTIRMVNCNVVRNTAASGGGGLYLYSARGRVEAYNTIVWGNKVGSNDNQLNETALFIAQGCAVQGGYSGGITLNAENDGTGFGYPRFAAPTAAAGVDVNNAIGDWSLSAGSACINAGKNSAVTDDVDLQGNVRIQQEKVDVGAFESALLPQGLTPQAQSNIIYVTPTGAGLQDGSSWGNATSNLPYAMETACGCEPVATVWVAQGVYPLSAFLQPGVAVYGGLAGNEPANYNLAQRNFSQHASIIDTAASYILLAQSYPFEEASRGVLDGFTLRNGGIASSSWDEGKSSVTLLGNISMKNVLFTGNYNNTATNCDFSYCTFRQNKRNGIYANNCRLDDCIFEENAWNGVYAKASVLSRCTAQNNGNAGNYAGFSLSNSSVMSECVSSNNYGYGISSTSSTVFNSTVNNNNGRGLHATAGLYYNVNVANNSNQSCAGIYATNNAKFINCNVVNNKSLSTNYCGGIYGKDGCEFTNCIVWGNKNNSGVSNIEGGGTYSYCAVEGGIEGTANINLAASNTGTGTDHVRFAAPSDTAGVTTQQNRDWRLSAGSACINAGNAVNTSLNLPDVDLAGSLRVKQQRIDIGAYEYGDVTYQTVNDTICLGSDFFFGDYYVYPETAGLFVDTFTYYENGMDYIANIRLMVGDVYQHNLTASICEGESYLFHGRQLTQTGVYEAYLQSAEGCDSTLTLQLTVLPKSYHSITETACETYTWNGITYNASGDYVQTLTAANGCDSVVTLHLTINRTVRTEWSQTACETYTWNGITYNASGDYVQTLTAANGCDSVVTLHLTINHNVTSEWNHATCGESYIWNGITYHASGDYVQTLQTANGCDSVVTLHLTIVPDTMPQILVSGQIVSCTGGTATLSLAAPYSNYVWSTGDTSATLNVTTAGYYWVTVTDPYGCETVSQSLQLGESALIEGTPSLCMVGVENGHNLLIWEEMSDTDVQFYKIYRENDRANVFEPLAVVSSSEANVYEDNTSDPSVRAYRYRITAMDVCQSETPLSTLHKTVHLTINRGIGNSWNLIWTPYEGAEIVSCKLYRGTTPYNMQQIATMPATLTSYTDYTNQNGALFYQIEMVMDGNCVRRTRDVSYAGARSNVVHNGMPVQIEQTLAVCDSFVWNGTTLTASGDYVDTVNVNNAYDSITTLHLTVNASVYAVLADTVCFGSDYAAYGFEWIQPTSGIHRDTLLLTSAAGCDSTVYFTLTVLDLPRVSISGNLEVQQGESTVLTASGAEAYIWSTGETASAVTVAPSETTTYSVTGTDGYGCRNADTAVVTVNVGIAEQNELQVRLWPNPAGNVVFVECQGLQRIEIFAATGQMMMAYTYQDADNETVQVNTAQYPNGVYLVRVTDAKGRQTTHSLVVAH